MNCFSCEEFLYMNNYLLTELFNLEPTDEI